MGWAVFGDLNSFFEAQNIEPSLSGDLLTLGATGVFC